MPVSAKQIRTVKLPYRLFLKGKVSDLVIDSTDLKVISEGEWEVRKHGHDKCWVWRKLHLAVGPATHDIVAAGVSLVTVHDAGVLTTLRAKPAILRESNLCVCNESL